MSEETISETQEQDEPKKKLTEIAEFRMLLYVIPVAIVFVLISIILG